MERQITMDNAEILLIERLILLSSALLIGALFSWIAWWFGFYRFQSDVSNDKLSLTIRHVIEAFLIFLSVELLFVPFFYSLWNSWELGVSLYSSAAKLDRSDQTWLNVWGALFTIAALLLYVRTLPFLCRSEIFGTQGIKKGISLKLCHYLFGLMTWFIMYPWVIAVGQGLEIVVELLHIGPHVDQIAVKHLKGVLENPKLFWLMAATVVFVIPFLEELLFRGFLQAWLKNHLGSNKAIVVSSMIFSLFHFSLDQKIENIELLASLFLVACYLGLLKEKKQSIWASFGLHSTFNGVNVLMLWLS